ncbi:glucans biosynthesis glucosyltransferase MdoH [Roseospira marina]|uniref:Glucans biosynthesis glucosyltransferase H n=1 Tax=Roseospira marina TaxID=140057 RepID=A0A5M6IDE4_9PROT|nr:glucans biosynthesis glucosyltransferase MdoH [Roseospira marina]KAA5606300.1 glucans biosynthesis glucosyltransferase MdoH [Roseospira marina]MBB4314461.1 membrane glycosyltransferase [Roseospira marina]MBB5087621.1 membrane glycosyltransferase [Roseospira marina]
MVMRRRLFLLCVLGITLLATQSFLRVVASNGLSPLDVALIVVFLPLAAWLAQSFCTLTAGALLLAWGRLRYGNTMKVDAEDRAAGLDPSLPRVALIMPIYNEDTARVFAGVAAMRDDLAAVGVGARFDVFVISDTTDPDVWLAETVAWQAERAREPGTGLPQVFYRRRLANTRRKTGNIEDFVERWGGAYGAMVTLDADSILDGRTIWHMTRRLDAHPKTALIQAAPKLVRGKTLFARMLQFAGDVYGPLSAAGIAFWAGGEGNYWGHNAIIRLSAFADCCGLPRLPGREPLGGEILSHDFVEAALLRRAGWRIEMAWDLSGSYEEPPPTLSDFVVRDRRWCQGNLQHGRILMARRLHWVSRIHLLTGIMGYLTSPLWLVFLILAGLQAWTLSVAEPVYFRDGTPWATWPVSREDEAALLLAGMMGLLFLPKVWGLLLALADTESRTARGGAGRLVSGVLVETVLSALIAPIMMVRHSRFVVAILTGSKVDWSPQRRIAGRLTLVEAVKGNLDVLILGLAASVAVVMYAPGLGWWLVPVVAGLIGAPLLSLKLDDGSSDDAVNRWAPLGIPEDQVPPPVLARLDPHEARFAGVLAEGPEARFETVLRDPRANALHRALIAEDGSESTLSETLALRAEVTAVHLGPELLTRDERRALLERPGILEQAHDALWAGKALEKAEAAGPPPMAVAAAD